MNDYTDLRENPIDFASAALDIMEEIASQCRVPTAWIIELRCLGDEWEWWKDTSHTRLVMRDIHSALSSFRIALRERLKATHVDWRKNELYNDCSKLLLQIEQSYDLFYTNYRLK